MTPMCTSEYAYAFTADWILPTRIPRQRTSAVAQQFGSNSGWCVTYRCVILRVVHQRRDTKIAIDVNEIEKRERRCYCYNLFFLSSFSQFYKGERKFYMTKECTARKFIMVQWALIHRNLAKCLAASHCYPFHHTANLFKLCWLRAKVYMLLHEVCE